MHRGARASSETKIDRYRFNVDSRSHAIILLFSSLSANPPLLPSLFYRRIFSPVFPFLFFLLPFFSHYRAYDNDLNMRCLSAHLHRRHRRMPNDDATIYLFIFFFIYILFFLFSSPL